MTLGLPLLEGTALVSVEGWQAGTRGGLAWQGPGELRRRPPARPSVSPAFRCGLLLSALCRGLLTAWGPRALRETCTLGSRSDECAGAVGAELGAQRFPDPRFCLGNESWGYCYFESHG